MTGEQLLVLVLLAAAFAAGWLARGVSAQRQMPAPEDPWGDDDAPATLRAPDPEPEHARPAPAPEPAAADPRTRAREALEEATERWLDDGATPSREGLEAAAAAADALAAAGPDDPDLQAAHRALAGFRDGRPLDAEALRVLDRAERRLAEPA